MMTDREKLVELLQDGHNSVWGWFPNNAIMLSLADYLLANGVTFATDTNDGGKWIPVSERLPDNKEHDWVLAQVVEDNGFMHVPKVMEYRQKRNDWYEETYGWLSEHNGAFIVTHWMPLPSTEGLYEP